MPNNKRKEMMNDTDSARKNFIILNAIKKYLCKDMVRLQGIKTTNHNSMHSDSDGSYSRKKRSLQEMYYLLDWQKQIAMNIASNKNSMTPNLLLEGVEPFPISQPSPWSILSKFDMSTLESENQEDLKNMSAEELINYCRRKGDIKADNPFIEGQWWENKAKINDPRGIAKGLIEAIASMHNARILSGSSDDARVACGISDDYEAVGLENELVSLHPDFSKDKWINILLRNVAHTYTLSAEFERNLEFHWYTYQNHLILVLSIKEFDDLVLVDPRRWTLPVRVGASVRRLQGYDLLKALNRRNNKLNN